MNLDPFERHSDDDMWRALDRAHLGSVVRGHASGLDMEVDETGAPLSCGQVQMLSLARVIMQDTKVRRPISDTRPFNALADSGHGRSDCQCGQRDRRMDSANDTYRVQRSDTPDHRTQVERALYRTRLSL